VDDHGLDHPGFEVGGSIIIETLFSIPGIGN